MSKPRHYKEYTTNKAVTKMPLNISWHERLYVSWNMAKKNVTSILTNEGEKIPACFVRISFCCLLSWGIKWNVSSWSNFQIHSWVVLGREMCKKHAETRQYSCFFHRCAEPVTRRTATNHTVLLKVLRGGPLSHSSSSCLFWKCFQFIYIVAKQLFPARCRTLVFLADCCRWCHRSINICHTQFLRPVSVDSRWKPKTQQLESLTVLLEELAASVNKIKPDFGCMFVYTQHNLYQ